MAERLAALMSGCQATCLQIGSIATPARPFLQSPKSNLPTSETKEFQKPVPANGTGFSCAQGIALPTFVEPHRVVLAPRTGAGPGGAISETLE